MYLSKSYVFFVSKSFAFILSVLVSYSSQAGALERLFSPKAELWQRWSVHAPASIKRIDHSLWDRFLQSNVIQGSDGINRIAYAKVDPHYINMLSNYIASMQNIIISEYSRPQQRAYWINLYNSLTVKIVLDHYPIKSIRDIDISPGLFSDGPWGKKLLMIEKHSVSLNDIEHKILRPIWRDPRTHYVVNCASLGCPNLPIHALSADNIEHELDTAAYEFVNNHRGVRFIDNDLYVSSIYSWFQDDFGHNEAEVINHLRKFAKPALLKQLKDVDSITDDTYDWSLNDASVKSSEPSDEE